jgi:hypothetical protein
MSRWAQISNQHRKHLQESDESRQEPSEVSSVESFVEELLMFSILEDLDLDLESENLIEDMEALARTNLEETTRDRLRNFIEMAKKMVFKMLDKTKKTVTIDDEDEEQQESLTPLTGPHGNPRAEAGSDAVKFIEEIKKKLSTVTRDQFLRCEVSTRFARHGISGVFIKYAQVPKSSGHLDVLNAEVGIHISVDGFGGDGNMKGKKIKVEVLTQRGMKMRGKTGTMDQCIRHIVKAITTAAKGYSEDLDEASIGSPTPYAGSESMLGRPRPVWMSKPEKPVALLKKKDQG